MYDLIYDTHFMKDVHYKTKIIHTVRFFCKASTEKCGELMILP